MHFNNSYILFNTNVEKDDSETNELSLSFRYNIFSCDFTNEEDVQDRKEGISIMNLFNDKLNINEDLDDFYFKAYFIQEKNNTNNDNPQENELINQKKEIKKLRKKRKLNREVKEIAIKRHTASDDDNILRKIQVQYISFIIHCSNDVVSFFVDDYTNNPCFKDVDYELKKVVNHEKVESLKEKTIGDIIQFDITPKIKKKEKNENEKSLKLILKKCPSLQKYFKTNYLEFFKKYYKNENDYLEVNGQIIPFSDKTKTKTFSSLIEKKKNNNLKERIKYVCINYLMNSYKKMKKPNFQTKIFN
jgi:hypothetical protein